MAGLRLHSPMLHPEHYCSQRRVRGQSYWLGFLCKTLSFSVSSRFIPALSLTPELSPVYHTRGTITKSTTPMEPKHDHSVEIYQKSHDMNLEISHDNNLGFNTHVVRSRSVLQKVSLYELGSKLLPLMMENTSVPSVILSSNR